VAEAAIPTNARKPTTTPSDRLMPFLIIEALLYYDLPTGHLDRSSDPREAS
jgi:hypothetical protein